MLTVLGLIGTAYQVMFETPDRILLEVVHIGLKSV